MTGIKLAIQTAYIGAKGPTFFDYDWSQAGYWRIGVNEAASLIPDCVIACGVDKKPLQLFEELPVKYVITSPRKKHVKPTIHWDKKYQSSGAAAVGTCVALGAKEIHLIGFDSLKGDYRSFGRTLSPHIIEHTVSTIRQLMKERRDIIWKIY